MPDTSTHGWQQYADWVKKNPLDGVERLKAAGASEAEIAAEKENIRFAWRPMEAGRRLQDLLTEFALTIRSPRFTPQFLNLFLRTYRQHADHILHNYSKQGNHLLFEAQRMLFAGIYFPEFREAAEWRRSGIEILNREIGVQVYPDGMQFELDFGYHIAAIDIFLKALGMASANGYESEFPASYVETVGKMTVVTWNLLFPDYSNPMFGDTKSHDKKLPSSGSSAAGARSSPTTNSCNGSPRRAARAHSPTTPRSSSRHRDSTSCARDGTRMPQSRS